MKIISWDQETKCISHSTSDSSKSSDSKTIRGANTSKSSKVVSFEGDWDDRNFDCITRLAKSDAVEDAVVGVCVCSRSVAVLVEVWIGGGSGAVVELIVGLRNSFEDGVAEGGNHVGIGGEEEIVTMKPDTSNAHFF